jgi:hypothetical protein
MQASANDHLCSCRSSATLSQASVATASEPNVEKRRAASACPATNATAPAVLATLLIADSAMNVES